MKVIKFSVIVCVVLSMLSCNSQGITNKSLDNDIDSVSYAIGLDMANKFKVNFNEVDKDLFIQGFSNGIDSTKLLIKSDDIQMVLQSFFQKKQLEDRKKQQEVAAKKAETKFGDVKKEGETFLAENKSKEGVNTTESGLQYIVLKEGEGEKPVATTKVKVHYHGTLIDGTVFDSSVDRGTPAEFYLNGVIKGWTEGLQLMSAGSKYKFFVPQELAYGATPRPGVIKPFAALIFEVELLEIIK